MKKTAIWALFCFLFFPTIGQGVNNAVLNAIRKQYRETGNLPIGWSINKSVLVDPSGNLWGDARTKMNHLNAMYNIYLNIGKMPSGWQIQSNIITDPQGISWIVERPKKVKSPTNHNFMISAIHKNYKETGMVPNGWQIKNNALVDPQGRVWLNK